MATEPATPSPRLHADSGEYVASVQAYWEETTKLYLEYGTTFQGGFLTREGDQPTATTSNLCLARRANIQPGERLLDAGCGVCGPSIDIALSVEGVSIDAVTISPRQAGIARDAISAAGLSDRIRVHVADYHRLEFDDESFDQVFFFESLYSLDLAALFNGVRRVLRPGGRLYAKEVLRQEHRLSATELAAVGEFEEIFQYKVHRMSDLVSGVEQAGFVDVEAIDLNDQISSAHYQRAMVEFVFGFPLPTEFGRRHWRQFDSAPLLFGELKARNPR